MRRARKIGTPERKYHGTHHTHNAISTSAIAATVPKRLESSGIAVIQRDLEERTSARLKTRSISARTAASGMRVSSARPAVVATERPHGCEENNPSTRAGERRGAPVKVRCPDDFPHRHPELAKDLKMRRP
jgi:hypothetical protein